MSLERFTRRPLTVIDAERPAIEAAELMHADHVGCVVVVAEGRPIGIVTDRDLALRVLAANRPSHTPVREVMSGDLAVARLHDSIDLAVFAMRQHGVRRLPIVDDAGTLVGLVALDDLLVLLAGETSSAIEAVLENRGP
jgi:CBS domain-containing protein